MVAPLEAPRTTAGEVQITALTPFVASRYASLTFAAHRPLIESFTHMPSIAGRCASVDGEPVGLALATLTPHGAAVLLSIYVARPFRGRGIATELLRRLEHDLAERGQRTLGVCYVGESDGAQAIERLLQTRGWPPDADRVHFFTIDGAIMSSPWFSRAVLPSDFEIGSWSTVTPEERAGIAAAPQGAPWIPAPLVPLLFEFDVEPLNSLVLRRRGAIVGWLLTQPLTPTTIRYANLFVRPGVNRAGRTFASLALLAEAVRRQVGALGVRSRGRFEVERDNVAFLRFIDRHLSPHVLEHVEKQRRIKLLPGPLPVSRS